MIVPEVKIPKLTQHEIQRTQMTWKTKEGFKSMKYLSENHLKNILKCIKLGRTIDNPNGYTKENWTNCINQELRYRNSLVSKIFSPFNKVLVEVDNKEQRVPLNKVMFQ